MISCNTYKLNRSLAYKLDRINKHLVIPPFNITCGEPNKSIYLERGNYLKTDRNVSIPEGEITLEFWINCLNIIPDSRFGTSLSIFHHTVNPFPDLMVYINGQGKLTVYVGMSSLTLTDIVPYNTWTHYAITVNTDKLLSIYQNGILVASTTVASSLTNIVDNPLTFGDRNNAGFYGYISDIRLWKVCRTADEVSRSMSSPRSIYFDTEPNLICYWKGNQLTEDSSKVMDIVGAEHLGFYDKDANIIIDGTDFITDISKYPRTFGASWPVASASIDVEKPCSIKFPNKQDSNNTSSLVVNWIDSDGISQRRYLWKATSVNFGAIDTPEYNGEVLTNPFNLEVWCIDGEEFATSPDEIKLHLSLTTMPTTSIDKTSIKQADAVLSNAIYSTVFPLTFPITFNNTPEDGEVTLLNIAVNGGDLQV